MAVVESNEVSTGLHASKAPEGVVQWIVTAPARLIEFLKETRAELRKVVTPTRAEVQSTTIVVLVTVFMFAAFFALVDLTLGRSLDKWLLHLTK